MRVRVGAKVSEGYRWLLLWLPVRADIAGFELVQRWDAGETGLSIAVEDPLDPSALAAALGLCLAYAQAFGQLGADAIVAL